MWLTTTWWKSPMWSGRMVAFGTAACFTVQIFGMGKRNAAVRNPAAASNPMAMVNSANVQNWPDGVPIFPLVGKIRHRRSGKGFKESGYLPEALINFSCVPWLESGNRAGDFLDGRTDQRFLLERINKAGARFDIQKAQWFNQQYIKTTPNGCWLIDRWKNPGHSVSKETAAKIVSIMKERVTFPQEIWEQAKFLFFAPTQFDDSVVSKKWNDEAIAVITAFKMH